MHINARSLFRYTTSNMTPIHAPSTLILFLRSLLPSTASAIFCTIGGIVFVAGGILLDSLNYGTILL